MEGLDFDYRLTPAYTEGVLLAVNALRDVALVIEGPGCVNFKFEQVGRVQDWHSTLFHPDGTDRVATTNNRPVVALGGTRYSETLARAMLEELRPSVLFLMPFTVSAASGADIDMLAEKLSRESDRARILELPGRTLSGDWLEGWAAVCGSLASGLDLAPGPLDGDAVALVGTFFGRNEGDDLGNVREMQRLLARLGLRVRSTWLDGGDVAGLREAGRCGWIVSLPYAREAARVLAGRTGAGLVECGLPLGLQGTTDWLRAVGRATGRQDAAEAVIDDELGRAVGPLRNAVGLVADRIAVAVVAEPHLAWALQSALQEVGVGVPLLGLLSGAPVPPPDPLPPGTRVLQDPSYDALDAALRAGASDDGIELVLGSGKAQQSAHKAGVGLLEMGFPSHMTHFLTDTPTLGYRGFLRLFERVVNGWGTAHAWRLMDEDCREGSTGLRG